MVKMKIKILNNDKIYIKLIILFIKKITENSNYVKRK